MGTLRTSCNSESDVVGEHWSLSSARAFWGRGRGCRRTLPRPQKTGVPGTMTCRGRPTSFAVLARRRAAPRPRSPHRLTDSETEARAFNSRRVPDCNPQAVGRSGGRAGKAGNRLRLRGPIPPAAAGFLPPRRKRRSDCAGACHAGICSHRTTRACGESLFPRGWES